jgi:hypothetical protein
MLRGDVGNRAAFFVGSNEHGTLSMFNASLSDGSVVIPLFDARQEAENLKATGKPVHQDFYKASRLSIAASSLARRQRRIATTAPAQRHRPAQAQQPRARRLQRLARQRPRLVHPCARMDAITSGSPLSVAGS